MKKILDLFIDGLKTILTAPFWLTFFIYKMLESLILFIFLGIKAIIMFFKGRSIFDSKEDKAIEIMKQQDLEAIEQRKKEALKNAENI